jgi:phosphohistidine phosphatase
MKTLLLVRHAKSGWENRSLSDFVRVLTDRGKSDAKLMAKRIEEKDIKIDALISSSAKRAKETAEIFLKELQIDKSNLQLLDFLYEASVKNFYHTVQGLNDEDKTVALFSHNPGITEFVNSLDCHPVYDMPTCAVFACKIELVHWRDFRDVKKEFLFFDYPKSDES